MAMLVAGFSTTDLHINGALRFVAKAYERLLNQFLEAVLAVVFTALEGTGGSQPAQQDSTGGRWVQARFLLGVPCSSRYRRSQHSVEEWFSHHLLATNYLPSGQDPDGKAKIIIMLA